ncbi:hypothetical protein [Edwardsiella tarda]|uniref:hypothetical protein n=1 Tax=Edwardsiella tarda TaxID=636 RepID=UPI00351CA5C1
MKYNPNYLRAIITLPVLFIGLNIYIVILHELFVFILKGRWRRRNFIFLLAPTSFIIIAFIQYNLNYNGESIFGVLSDVSLRTYDTMGAINLSGNVNFVDVFKMATYFLLVFLLYNNIKSLSEWHDFFKKIIKLNFFVVIPIFLFSFSPFLVSMLKAIALNSSNFLTVDDFGYRISGFYYEPSQFSLMMSTVLAILYFSSKDIAEKGKIIFVLFVFFLLSRSVTLVASFLLCSFLLYRPKTFVAFSCCIFFIVINSEKIIELVYGSSPLFRSLLARTVITNYTLTFPYNMFGADFGNVTSFYPFYGIVFQSGYFGLLIVFLMFKFRIPLIMLILLLFSVSPRLWYIDIYLPSLFLFVVYSYQYVNRIEEANLRGGELR